MTDQDPAFGQPGTFLHTVIVWTLIAAFVATALTLGPPLLLTGCVRTASSIPTPGNENFIRGADATMDAIEDALGELNISLPKYRSAPNIFV
jgi:hypothetical protein